MYIKDDKLFNLKLDFLKTKLDYTEKGNQQPGDSV